jgi:hypothetical protein
MATEKTIWDHLQGLAELAASVPDERLWLDSVVAELPGIEPRARQSLRTQLQLVIGALPAITHLARDTGAIAPPPAKTMPNPSSPSSVPYR